MNRRVKKSGKKKEVVAYRFCDNGVLLYFEVKKAFTSARGMKTRLLVGALEFFVRGRESRTVRVLLLLLTLTGRFGCVIEELEDFIHVLGGLRRVSVLVVVKGLSH